MQTYASVWQVHVEVGQEVTQGEELIVLESMKMEIPVEASIAAAVTSLSVAPGDTVKRGDVLLAGRAPQDIVTLETQSPHS